MPDAGVAPQLQGQATAEPTSPPANAAGPGAGQHRSTRTLAIAAAIVVGLVLLLKVIHVQEYLLDLVNWIRGAGWLGLLVFVVAYILATVLFLPGAILTLGAGFAYGVGVGTAVVWVAANSGAALAFQLGRTLARRWVATRVAAYPRFAAIDRAVGGNGFKIVLLTRLSPVFPFNLLNYAFGLTNVSPRDYVLGSLIGMLPGTVMYVYLGSLITSLSELAAGRRSGGAIQEIFYFAGLAVTVGVTVYVTRIARRALAEVTEVTEHAPETARQAGQGHVAQAQPGSVRLLPDDEHNRALISALHPSGWVNPRPAGRYNLVVIGAGTAGLVSAAGAAGLGAKVALIERHLLGGDCLNVGCVPSKALISAARVAASARHADAFGVHAGPVTVDFAAVMERMRRLRAAIAPHDSVHRFTELGVDVFLGSGRFRGPATLEVGGQTLEFARAVITTGARAAGLSIPGLEDTGYLTNETVFELTELPARLAVIGAGPIGCELAQTFRRFGSQVTVFEAEARVLPREDPDAADIIARALRAEGVRLELTARIERVERRGPEIQIDWQVDGRREQFACDAILLGIGRAPNVEGLGLEEAGVAYDARGIRVNDFLQTTNPRVYAAGDIASPFKFTHMADALARIVLTNALFAGRKKASALHVPWCTYTQPEIAHVGLYEHEAAARGHDVHTITVPMREVDRAILDGAEDGFLRVHVEKGTDRILGATLVADHAGDIISEITVAMVARRGLGTIANAIHPYPTQAEVIKKAADAYNRSRLTPRVKTLFDWWLRARR